MLTTAQKDYWQHRVKVGQERAGDEEIKFTWHWPRGTFDARMSAFEIAAFLLPHMPAILPLLGDHPRIQAAWQALLNRFILWPKEVIDEVVPWCRRLPHDEEDEIVELNLAGWYVANGPVYFVGTA